MNREESNVDRLLKAKAGIDEELRRYKSPVTIVFTDVVGSTAYFDRYGDTAGFAIMHRHADLATTCFNGFQGKVIKTIGDSVMAEFPEARLAVRASVELQRRLVELNQSLPVRDRLQVRVGINSGIGYRRDEDVFGDVVNLAARITKHTGPAQILVSRVVWKAISSEVDLICKRLGEVTIKGKVEKEDVFEVIWTDAPAYSDLRKNLTAAFARGELVSPGTRPEDLLSPSAISTPGSDATIPTISTSPSPTVTARYSILEEIGRGGMGVVYKAEDHETREIIALKVVRPELAADAAMMERFRNELRLARKVTHKNVCRIYDFGRSEGAAYISMEFVDGVDLRAIIQRSGGLPLQQGLDIAAQICAGLSEAHTQGIVHRDLKPENVMLDRSGIVKLMDFGIARSMDLGARMTGGPLGTPAYMAPEQAEGKLVDQRSDIYAVGLILYEVFSGVPAFAGDTPVAVALKQIREAPRPLRDLAPTFPHGLEQTILRCLAKDPAQRFQSVRELQKAIEKESEPIHAVTSSLSRLRFPSELSRKGAALVSAGLLFLVALLTAAGWALGEIPIMRRLELKGYDLRFLLRGSLPSAVAPALQPGPITIVMIDDKTDDYVQRPKAKPRIFWTPEFGEVLRAAAAGGARVIGLDWFFSYSVAAWEPQADPQFFNAYNAVGQQGVPVILAFQAVPSAPTEARDTVAVYYQAMAEGNVGYANLSQDADLVIRKLELVSREGHSSLTGRMAAVFLKTSLSKDGLLGARTIPQVAERTLNIQYYGPRGQVFPQISMADVLEAARSGNREKLRNWFDGRAVLIGPDDLLDRHATPFLELTEGVEIHAHALSTLIRGDFIRPSSTAESFTLAFLAALSAGIVASYLRWILGLLAVLGLVLLVFLVSLVAFAHRLDLPVVRPLLAMMLVSVATYGVRVLTHRRRLPLGASAEPTSSR